MNDEHFKSQMLEFKQAVTGYFEVFSQRLGKISDDVSDIRSDLSNVKNDVNVISSGLGFVRDDSGKLHRPD